MLLRDFLDPTMINPFSNSLFERMGFNMERLQKELNGLQDQEINRDISVAEDDFSVWVKGVYPKMNVFRMYDDDTFKGLKIIAAVPGYKEEEISASVSGGEITIEVGIDSGKKEKPEKKNERLEALLAEVPHRYSKAVVGITGKFDFEKATANFPRDGTLVIEIPAKIEQKEEPRKLLGN